MADDDSSVRVAVRIRPQIAREVIDMCRVCTTVTPSEPQVTLGSDKAFTYDFVFDMNSAQNEIYDKCVASLVDGSLEGYNATVLAYGQTGSGKTYTMGTGFEVADPDPELVGIIPRALHHLFSGIDRKVANAREMGQPPPEFKLVAQFMELYNEEVIDLFDSAREQLKPKSGIKIHEDAGGGIYVVGVTMRPIASVHDALECLRAGALSRTTASTQMNSQSSRSHAIFTLHIKQQRLVKIEDLENGGGSTVDGEENGGSEFETLSAKFHFVDLAGSERLKRTGATGERAREGISINCGLLALGNVISALGDKSKRATHVPYRDSKLTRLLQDSLGGNSQTVMIACVSPSDQDFMETLNTLKYANRARNIKNRIMINQDKSSRTISILRQEIQQLQLELLEYKQGKRIVGDDGTESINDMFHENTMLQTEISNLRTRVKAMQETVDALTMKNTQLLAERATSNWVGSGDGAESDVTEILQGYLKEIEQLRAKLLESEALCTQLRKAPPRMQGNPGRLSLAGQMNTAFLGGGDSSANVLEEARRDLAKDLELLHSKSGASINSRTDEKSSSLADEAGGNEDDNTDSDSNDSLDSDSDSEEKETEGKIGLQIAELTSEITVKQKLIEELEMSQRRLHTMRQHYEDKLLQLEERIRATQNERDKVLSSINLQSKAPPDKVKKVRDEYEKKLTHMQKEMRRLQTAQKEHARLLRNQSQHENQLRLLKSDLDEMKRAKVKLMTRMREESSKHKAVELRRAREIAQLRKESRRRDNQIRSLEAEKRAKEVVLRRKQEEVTALRRQARGGLSRKAAGRVLTPANNLAVVADLKKRSSPAQCKHKWQTLENNINKISLNKQTVATLERDMERHLKERESLCHTLEQLTKKRDRALLNRRDDLVRDLDDQIESMQATIDFIQESIGEAQRNIIQIEESKESFDSAGVSSVVANLEDIAEARYLIEKLYNMTVNQCYTAAQKDLEAKELEAKFQQVSQESRVERELLQHVLTTSDLNEVGLLMDPEPRPPNASNAASLGTITAAPSISSSHTSGLNEVGIAAISPSSTGSEQSSRSVSPTYFDNGSNGNNDGVFIKPQFTRREHKLRRRTAVPEDLLYPTSGAYPGAPAHEEVAEDNTNYNNSVLKRIHATPASLKLQDRVEACRSPGAQRKPFLTPNSALINNSEMTSPKVTRRPLHGSLDQGLDTSPPGSPPSYRRQTSREENVFSRLTSSTNIGVEQPVGQGVIQQYNGKVLPKAPLICTHLAEGHSRAVLALDVTDQLLFTASKDRTVKVWDLETGRERDTLRVHPNNVVAVHYDEGTRLVFSTSASYVKIWDLRTSVSKCIKTLSSSGVTTSGLTPHLPAGESLLTAVALNPTGSTLYTATGDRVRVWDLRRFETTAKLSGGHQAAIMCLAVDRISETEDLVITGSKDHYIKVFEVNEKEMISGAVIPPKMNLNPPHYDGIQSLAISNDTLFSGSRDTCIKKWDLSRQELVTSMNNAHKDWVCGLTLMQEGRMLVSACRGGVVKLWSADSCQCLATIKAHSSQINAVKANRTGILFTAGNDGSVRFWRLNSRRFDSSSSSSPVDVANATFLVTPSTTSTTSSSSNFHSTAETSASSSTSGLPVLRRLLSAPNAETNVVLPY